MALRIYSFSQGSGGSGGTSNSFTIFQTDFGTFPTATSPNDTITFTSSDGSVIITGNAGTDTINLRSTGGGGGSGSVTSVGLTAPPSIFNVFGSPVTSAGVLGISLNVQNPNTFWGGPLSGSPAAPTFRAIGSSDLPTVLFPQGITGVLGAANLPPIPLPGGVTGILSLANLPAIPSSGLTGIIDYSHIPLIPFPTGLTNTAGIPFGITTQHGLTLSATQILDIGLAGLSAVGALGMTDFGVFNAKQAALPWTTAGDINYLGLVPSPLRLPIGSVAQVLTVGTSLLPIWAAASGNSALVPVKLGGTGASLPTLALNDLIIGGGSTFFTTFPLGIDGQVLTSSGPTMLAAGNTLAWRFPVFHPPVVGVSSTPYNVVASDRWLNVSSGVTAIVINMLSATMRVPLYIKDIGGTCSANNITVIALGSELIEGIGTTNVIQTDYGGRWYFPDGTNWWLQ